MKILIAGDCHANINHFNYLCNEAKVQGCTMILQVGDFGFCPKFNWGLQFLYHVNRIAEEFNLHIGWLDGNHEDHDMIDAMTNGDNTKTYITKGLSREYPNIHYYPRGYRFEVDGVSFMTYGGAFSVDRAHRKKYISWFPQEMIDLEHIRSIEPGHVDVLLTHDVPYGYQFRYDEYSQLSLISANARTALLELCYKTTPFICIGGHHHLRATYDIVHSKGEKKAKCHILNCDKTGAESWMILDTAEIKKQISSQQ